MGCVFEGRYRDLLQSHDDRALAYLGYRQYKNLVSIDIDILTQVNASD
jgi:hypothetical protein